MREGGLRPAARKLHVTEPTISAQIKQLEDALGEKLLRKAGRRLQPTASGQTVLAYADEIFSLGNELLLTVRQQFGQRSLRLHLGVVDSVSKVTVALLLGPVFKKAGAHLICSEGSLTDLAGKLAIYKLDAILADEPLTSALAVKAFNTKLASDTVTWVASPVLAKQLRRNFPASLADAPMILPTEEMPMRRTIEIWFRENRIQPRIIAEAQDTALIKHLAAEGVGCTPLATSVLKKRGKEFGLAGIGLAKGAVSELFLCTAERKVQHPFLRELIASNLA